MSNTENKPLVLLVDDSVDVHRLLLARLRHEQIELVGTTRAVEAVEMARRYKPSTILLDVDMPDLDGFEVLRALKEEPLTNNVPVIILSAKCGSEDKVTAFDLGATDYVTKPFDLAELRARLRASLRLDHLVRLLSERADVDGLTGLGNRAAFNKRWAEKVAECRRYGTPLSLALLDVDFFKRINDTYGHPAGDQVLVELARMLQSESRSHDVACRYGGEEFALIMPNTGPQEAQVVTERVRHALATRVWSRHPDSPITASVGLVGTNGPVSEITPEHWLEATDHNLYVAKRAGRNRCVVTELCERPLTQPLQHGVEPQPRNEAA
ncbi:MAG TPA: diguanylate cyclase [Phycisphaerales bacterium]|nr:diguanylate cyclase [Phycisphaerales bacterium]